MTRIPLDFSNDLIELKLQPSKEDIGVPADGSVDVRNAIIKALDKSTASLYNNKALLDHVTEIVETVILSAHKVDTYLNPIPSMQFPVIDSKVMLDADRGMSYIIQYRKRFDWK